MQRMGHILNVFNERLRGNAASFLRTRPYQGCKHVCTCTHRHTPICGVGFRIYSLQPGLGIDPAATDFGDVSWPLSFSFFNSSRGMVTATQPAVERFTRIKSGPPRPNLAHRAPSVIGDRQHSQPSGRCRCHPTHTGHSCAGLAGPCLKPPSVGKGRQHWASSHLTSASALYRPHTMGLGTTPAPPSTPSLCTAGKWALPSTAGRGSSPGSDPHQSA